MVSHWLGLSPLQQSNTSMLTEFVKFVAVWAYAVTRASMRVKFGVGSTPPGQILPCYIESPVGRKISKSPLNDLCTGVCRASMLLVECFECVGIP